MKKMKLVGVSFVVGGIGFLVSIPTFAATTTLVISPKLSGISNAVMCNGNINFAYTEEVGSANGYPDGSKFSNLNLYTGKSSISLDKSGVVQQASNASIACDYTNKLHVAYTKWAGFSYAFDAPYLVFRDATLVTKNSIFEDANWGAFTDLALDVNDKAHVIQFAHEGYFLNYSSNVSGNWKNDDISGMGTYYNTPAIATDRYEKVHLLTSQLSSDHGVKGTLQYWTDSSSNWTPKTIATDSNGNSNMVSASYGNLYAAYVTNTNIVKLLSKTAGTDSWESQSVGTLKGIERISVAISPDGFTPYVAVSTSQELRLYTLKNSGWYYYSLARLTPSTAIAQSAKAPSILFGNGGPIVVYMSGTKILKSNLDGVTAKQ